MQDFDGSIELVVADDASHDKTLKMIKSYEAKDSRFTFKYLDSSQNLGITKNYQRSFPECSADYVAIMEGDDFWLSPKKLTKQVNFLEDHPECLACSCNYIVHNEEAGDFYVRLSNLHNHSFRYLSSKDLIEDNIIGNFSTIVYRKSALGLLPPKLFWYRSYDWIINITIASKGLIGFLFEPLSAYRIHSAGAHSQNSEIMQLKEQKDELKNYDYVTNHLFSIQFSSLENKIAQRIAHLNNSNQPLEIAIPLKISRRRKTLNFIKKLLPPILVSIFHAILPPIIKEYIATGKLR
jgi:glycosyltransferase involved in cell wall biosynthesis